MARSERPLSPHLQVYRWQLTMLLSILHRATGLLLAFGALGLVYWVAAAAAGPEPYVRARALLASPAGVLLMLAVSAAFFYHLGNGIRHLAWDLGLGFEKPQYRASGWVVVVAAAVLTALAWLVGLGVAGSAS